MTGLKIGIFILVLAFIIAVWLIVIPSLKPADEVLLIGMSLYVFIMTCIILLFFRSPEYPEYDNSPTISSKVSKDNLKRALRTREVWKILNIIWLSIYFCLNILMVLLPILVIYAAEYENANKTVIVYSIISICGTCAGWLIRPKEVAQGYHVAFESLNTALNRFLAGIIEWKDVLGAIDNGEKTIARTTYDSI